MVRTNRARICGTIETPLKLDYVYDSEKFYRTKVKIFRQSGKYDTVNLLISELFLHNGIDTLQSGMYVAANGQLRSYNIIGEDNRSHHEIMFFVTHLDVFEKKETFEEAEDYNQIYLEGYICKPPTYRITPFGREITDIMLSVERAYGKKDYIPCIAWGRDARYAGKLMQGNQLKLLGRFQSREYSKRVSQESEVFETKIAYEVSILKINNNKMF